MIRVTKVAAFKRIRKLRLLLAMAHALALGSAVTNAQDFFPLKEVHAGMHGVGRTIFQGNRIENFQVDYGVDADGDGAPDGAYVTGYALTAADWERAMGVNARGVVLGAVAAARRWRTAAGGSWRCRRPART